MNNNFSDETKELFIWNEECWYCGTNHADCYHHILGRSTPYADSPLNCAPINNMDCHIHNGKLSLFEIKKKFLNKTLRYLLERDYILTKKDKMFMNHNSMYY